MLGSINLSKKPKINLYTTLLRPVVLYGTEIWTLNNFKEAIPLRKLIEKFQDELKDNVSALTLGNRGYYTMRK